MRINAGYANFVPKNSTSGQLIHSGRGFVHAIVATVDAASGGSTGTLTLYDNTAAAGNVLFRAHVSTNSPLVVRLDRILALVFETGLTAVTSQYLEVMVVTEY
jgi:hypothetical protein